MRTFILSRTFCVAAFLFTIHQSQSFAEFQCLKKGGPVLPALPLSYSTDVRINFLTGAYSVDVKHATLSSGEKEYMEFKSKTRHVKYIIRKDQKKVLIINYKEDDQPKCTVKTSLDVLDFMESEDRGTLDVLPKFISANSDPTLFHYDGQREESGMINLRWSGCLERPKINVSYSFAAEKWGQPYVTFLKKVNYLSSAYAQIGQTEMGLLFSNFNPRTPDHSIFQPPADVYCEGFGSNMKPPKMPDYFSFISETTTYVSAEGVAPIVSTTKVYYDQMDGISRMDSYKPTAEDPDMFSEITVSEMSIIHDFNAGVQYEFDPVTGKCEVNKLQMNPYVILDGVMRNGNQFFMLDNAKFAYNGKFPLRGVMTDVYTAKKKHPQTGKINVISWFFSTEKTRIVETEKVEKNVLLRMNMRPETGYDNEFFTEINFYNFARSQPSASTYDISRCFNESYSKIMIITFPAHELLIGSEKLVGKYMHLSLRSTIGISKQRIFIREVLFNGKYIYAEFALLGMAPITNPHFKEISLDEAVKRLQNAVSENAFTVSVSFQNHTIVLRPEPNGLNAFAGDRNVKPLGYKEGSVIGLTVGMLFLGVLLGAVALNLIMSRKFGVSLFQKSKYGSGPFNNTRGESSM